MLKRAGQVAGHSLRVLHWVLGAALGLVGVGAVALGALAWRLSQGPIDLPWLAERLEAAANAGGGPTRLRIGTAALAWEGFRLGVDRPLDLRLTDLRAVAADGAVIDEIPRAQASVSFPSLLRGRVALRAMEIDGARLRVLRAPDGTTTLDLGSLTDDPNAAPGTPSPFAELLSDLARPPDDDRSAPRGGGGVGFRQFRRLLIRDAEVVVLDRQLGATWRAPQAEIDLRRQPGGGVSGTAEATLALGETQARLSAHAVLEAGGNATRVEAALTPVTPAVLARAVPSLAPLEALDAPVTISATLDLGPHLLPRRYTLSARAGAGTAHVGAGAVALSGLVLDATGDLHSVAVDRLRVQFAAPDGGAGPVLEATGAVSRAGGRLRGHAVLGLDRVAFAELPRYWPEIPGEHVRPWIVENITAGIAHDARFEVTAEARDDLSDLAVTGASGRLAGDDLTIHWLRPVPPLEHVGAALVMAGPDALEIDLRGGRQPTGAGAGALTLGTGTIRIRGLLEKDQFAAIDGAIEGSVPDALALLRHPRLKLLSRHPIALNDPSGRLDGALSVELPLNADLRMEQVGIRATARLADVHLGALAGGKDLDHGALGLKVDTDGMEIAGQADFAGIPAALKVGMDFRAGPPSQIVTRAALKGAADERQLAAAGIGTAGMLHGPAEIEAAYAQSRDDHASLHIHADLARAALDLGKLGWRKPAGEQASLAARLLLVKDRVTAVEALHAEGPGLALQGSSRFAAGRPEALTLDRIVIGDSRATGEIDFAARPGDPVRLRLNGAQLDLSGQFSRHSASTSRNGSELEGVPWAMQARFERVLLAGRRTLGPVSLTADDDGRVVRHARLELGGAARALAVLAPGGAGRRLSVRARDAGALLAAFDLTDTIRGGALAVEAQYDDARPDRPLSGTAQLDDFRLLDAPAAARVLQGMTLYGLAGALRGPGMGVNRLVAPFALDGDVLALDNARAFNPSLGVTLKGRIDLGREVGELEGTIVPAYAVNSLLGRIPLIGRLFSPEKGGGVFAATYSVRGPLKDPNVTVNPLAALTPGFLRGLFGVLPRR